MFSILSKTMESMLVFGEKRYYNNKKPSKCKGFVSRPERRGK
jgi:hypothetical protein